VALLVARQIALSDSPSDIRLANETLSQDSPLDDRVVWRPATHNRPIRVVVAEDSTLIRAGIVALLSEEGFDVCAEAGDRDGLVAAVRRERPELVITDVRMPPSQRDEGLTAAMELRVERPSLAVLVVSQHVEPSAADLLLGGGAGVGYLLKERVSDLDEFVATCRVVAAGGVVIDPLITEHLLQRRDDGVLDRLTDREREVLDLMAQGRSNAAIARDLHLAAKTLEAHVRSIFTKLDLVEHPDDHRRVAAVVHYLHHR
jgi:DNA-binding NarL/FixJ family response regulator